MPIHARSGRQAFPCRVSQFKTEKGSDVGIDRLASGILRRTGRRFDRQGRNRNVRDDTNFPVDPELLNLLFEYDGATGFLYWKKRPVEMFIDGRHTAKHAANRWNSCFAGARAFTAVENSGYYVGAIFNRAYKAHRIIWAMHHGEWPNGEIDHISGEKLDNRLSNLRVVSGSENRRNQKLPANNTSGAIGVELRDRIGRWQARIKFEGKNIHIGMFDTFEEAVAARKEAEKKYGFHPNHGRDA